MRKGRHYYIYRSVILSSLIYLIIVLGMVISTIHTPMPEEEEGVYIELENFLEDSPQLEEPQDETDMSAEERRNLAVNRALKDVDKTDPYDYSDVEEADEEYKASLVKKAISDEEYHKIFERDDLNIDDEASIEEEQQEVEEALNVTPSNFQGATYITYFLKDRHKIKIPVPTYKCEGSGKVIVNIEVNRKGIISSFSIDKNSTLDDCLIKAAKESVKRSKFNKKQDAPLKQRGTITYVFEAQ